MSGEVSLLVSGNIFGKWNLSNNIYVWTGDASDAADRMCRQLSVSGNVSLSQAQYFVSTASNAPPTHSGPAQTLIEGNVVDGANSQYGPTDANSIGIKLASSVSSDSVRVINNQITSKHTGVAASLVDPASHLDVKSNAFLSCVANVSGLSQLNDFASGDATPACRPDFDVYRTANATPTTITDFDGVSVGAGDVGRAITVMVNDANTTLDFSGSKLVGNEGVDWVASVGDTLHAVWDGTDWLCTLGKAAQTVFTGSATWNPGSISAWNTATTSVTCTGAVEGMFVECAHSDMTNAAEYKLHISGYVEAGGGSVVVAIHNLSGGTLAVGSGTIKVKASAT